MSDEVEGRRGRPTPTPYDIWIWKHREQHLINQEKAEAEEHRLLMEDIARNEARAARQCSVPIRPGYGQAAFKAGCEDEWIDRMKNRYGEDY